MTAYIEAPEPYDQQALELCDKCGWKAIVPGEPCLMCERNAGMLAPEPEPLTQERLQTEAETRDILLTAAPMSPANRLVAYSAATRLRELGFEWDATAEAWLQPAPSAQAVDHINMDSLRISHCKDAAVIDAARKQGGAT